MNSVSFSKATVCDPDDICPICQGALTERGYILPDVIGHDGKVGGEHPVHKACMLAWAKVQQTCPSCRRPVDMSSLFSWKGRTIVAIKKILGSDAVAYQLSGFMAGTVVLMTLVGYTNGAELRDVRIALAWGGVLVVATFIMMRGAGLLGTVLRRHGL